MVILKSVKRNSSWKFFFKSVLWYIRLKQCGMQDENDFLTAWLWQHHDLWINTCHPTSCYGNPPNSNCINRRNGTNGWTNNGAVTLSTWVHFVIPTSSYLRFILDLEWNNCWKSLILTVLSLLNLSNFHDNVYLHLSLNFSLSIMIHTTCVTSSSRFAFTEIYNFFDSLKVQHNIGGKCCLETPINQFGSRPPINPFSNRIRNILISVLDNFRK